MCTLLYDVLFFHALYLEDKSKKQWKADLKSANLECVNLKDADLEEVNLRGISLRGANLRSINLNFADLREVDLRDADLNFADLRDADLRGADLRDADLKGANLKGADLEGADLRGADLDFASVHLSCKFINVKGDSRLFSQLMYHLTRQHWELEGTCKDALKVIEKYADLFLEYRNDLVFYEDFKKESTDNKVTYSC